MLQNKFCLVRRQQALHLLAALVVMTGCGGGGGGGGGDAPPATFALQSAHANWVKNGSNESYTVSGFCGGTVSIQRTPATPAVFKSVAGFSSVGTSNIQYTGCSNPAFNFSGTFSGTGYFDASYALIGEESADSYTEFTTTRPVALPTSVVVGDQGTIGTLTNYTDNTKATFDSTTVSSYTVEADTPAGTGSVIVNFIDRDYDAANRLMGTTQFRHRLTAAGVLAPVSLSSVSDLGTLTLTRN